MPVTGVILEVNPLLAASPESVNQEPYGKGWLVRIRVENSQEIEQLLNADSYRELIGR
jgi:glycine cleavage system H protein